MQSITSLGDNFFDICGYLQLEAPLTRLNSLSSPHIDASLNNESGAGVGFGSDHSYNRSNLYTDSQQLIQSQSYYSNHLASYGQNSTQEYGVGQANSSGSSEHPHTNLFGNYDGSNGYQSNGYPSNNLGMGLNGPANRSNSFDAGFVPKRFSLCISIFFSL